jgi:hypothetical protein
MLTLKVHEKTNRKLYAKLFDTTKLRDKLCPDLSSASKAQTLTEAKKYLTCIESTYL